MTMHDLGKNIKYIREALLGLSQMELGEKIGLPDTGQSIISRLERGMGISSKNLLAILNFFNSNGVNAHYVFHDDFPKELLIKQSSYKPQSQLVSLIQEIESGRGSIDDKQQVGLLVNKLFNEMLG